MHRYPWYRNRKQFYKSEESCHLVQDPGSLRAWGHPARQRRCASTTPQRLCRRACYACSRTVGKRPALTRTPRDTNMLVYPPVPVMNNAGSVGSPTAPHHGLRNFIEHPLWRPSPSNHPPPPLRPQCFWAHAGPEPGQALVFPCMSICLVHVCPVNSHQCTVHCGERSGIVSHMLLL